MPLRIGNATLSNPFLTGAGLGLLGSLGQGFSGGFNPFAYALEQGMAFDEREYERQRLEAEERLARERQQRLDEMREQEFMWQNAQMEAAMAEAELQRKQRDEQATAMQKFLGGIENAMIANAVRAGALSPGEALTQIGIFPKEAQGEWRKHGDDLLFLDSGTGETIRRIPGPAPPAASKYSWQKLGNELVRFDVDTGEVVTRIKPEKKDEDDTGMLDFVADRLAAAERTFGTLSPEQTTAITESAKSAYRQIVSGGGAGSVGIGAGTGVGLGIGGAGDPSADLSDLTDAAEAVGKGLVSKEKARRMLKEAGYSDELIDQYLNAGDRSSLRYPSSSEIPNPDIQVSAPRRYRRPGRGPWGGWREVF